MSTKHTQTPWSLCCEGGCSCLTISCSDFPIAKVQSGKWGDDYPAMRQVGASLENKYEAFMEQITYGEINPEVALANAQFIVKAVNEHDVLVKIAEAASRVIEQWPHASISHHPMIDDLVALRDVIQNWRGV